MCHSEESRQRQDDEESLSTCGRLRFFASLRMTMSRCPIHTSSLNFVPSHSSPTKSRSILRHSRKNSGLCTAHSRGSLIFSVVSAFRLVPCQESSWNLSSARYCSKSHGCARDEGCSIVPYPTEQDLCDELLSGLSDLSRPFTSLR